MHLRTMTVGQLAEVDRRIRFEYDADFLARASWSIGRRADDFSEH